MAAGSKDDLRQLAVFGGEPVFETRLHVGRPNTGSRERFLERVNEALDRRWLTNGGPFVHELEVKIAGLLGLKHCITMSSGTMGLELVVQAAGLSGEVIVPSLTFVAGAHALQRQGIRPVFCDVDPLTHNLDPRLVEAAITPHTTGILATHLWGRPCDVEALTDIANCHGLTLLFDAAHAFGNTYQGMMVGGYGMAEVFSFHATKFFNTLEGGAVVTNDDALAEKLRLMKNFGFLNYDQVVALGTNGKMDEISAAMGLTLLEEIEDLIAVNRRNYCLYRYLLQGIQGLTVIAYDEREKNNYQYVILEIDEKESGLARDQVLDVLWAENILARRYFYPGCHRMEPYRTLYPLAGKDLPVTEHLAASLLALPTGPSVSEPDIVEITSLIRLLFAQKTQVARMLREKVYIPYQETVRL
jgi:dTDP-4-amino-4,6-dideoxygalactose transaminase